jgi:hypothetical protein
MRRRSGGSRKRTRCGRRPYPICARSSTRCALLPSGSVVQSRVRPYPARSARHRSRRIRSRYRCRWLSVRTPLPRIRHGAICGVGCRSQGVHWMCAGTLGEPARQARDARPAAAALKVQGAAGMALLLFGANAQRRTLRTGNTGRRGSVRSHGYRMSGSRSASTAPPSSRYSSGRITAACVVGVAPYWISGSEPVTAVPADPQHCPLAATRVVYSTMAG